MLFNKTASLRLGVLSVFAFALSFGLHAQTDVNKVVKAESSGSALYINIDYAALDLFNDSTIARLNPDGDTEWNTWKDALTNGNSPGMNVDFDSYAAFGLTDLDGSGDLTLGTITMTGFIIDGVGNATTNSLNNSNGGITNTGSIAGATSIDGSGDLTMGTVTMIGFSVDAAGAVDINSGTIDGATIATSDVTVGAGKTLDVSAGTLTLADDQISGDKVEGGTIASITISQLSGAMDANNQTMTNVDVNSGTIDGATIATSDVTVGAGKTLDVSAGTLTLADDQISGDKVEGGTIASITISQLSGAMDANNQTMTNVDVNSGTIDGATIATSDVTVGAGKTLDVSAGTLTLADDQISGDKVEGGTIASITISQLSGAMDANNQTMTNVDVNSGTIDGATIATSDVTVGAGKTLDVSAGTLTLADDQISGDKVEGGTIASITISQLSGAMDANNQTMTNVDVNSGTIDGATIATSDVTVGAAKTLDVSAGTLTLAAGQVDADRVGAGTFDAGSYSFNGSTISDLGTVTTADINGGTIDGATIATSDVTVGAAKTLDVSAGTLTLAAGQVDADRVGAGTFDAGSYSFNGSTISDLGTVTTADINGGTIDGATIATSDVTVGAAKTLDVSAGTLTLAAGQVDASRVGAGTFDAGSYSFNGSTISDLGTVTTADINGGTIDGATIATSDVTVGAAKTLDVSAGTLTLAAGQVDASRVGAGTFDAGSYSFNGSTISDLGTVTTADINGGTIDGATIATSDVTVGAAKTLDVSAGTLTLAAGQVDASRVGAGTFDAGSYSFNGSTISDLGTVTTADINGGTIDGADVTVGAAKTLDVSAGTLTLAAGQVDAGRVGAGTFDAGSYSFNGSTISDLGTVTTADINGGTIDGATIATSDVTVGAGKNLDVSAGTLTLAAGQVDAGRVGAGTFDAGSYSFNGSTISDLGTVTTADINGGTIDGATIATSDVTVGAAKTLDVSAGTLTLAAGQVDASRVGAGTFDAGSYSFNGSTISDLGTVTTADINGGTIDGATIATSDVTVGAAKTLDVSAGTLTLAAGQVDAGRVGAGTFDAGSYSFNGSTISDLGTVTTADINGGTIDGADVTVGAAKTLDVSAGTLTLAAGQVDAGRVGAGTFDAGSYSFNGSTISDLGTVTTADINGGTIDGATIATSDVTVGAGKNLDVSAGTLTLAAGQVDASRVGAGTFDAGSYSFNGSTISDLGTVTTADINGGTIDGADVTVGAGTTLDVSAGTLTLADDQISGDKVEGGTIAAISISQVSGANLITRASTADAEDLTVSQTGGTNSSVSIESSGTGADAVSLNASAGGISLTAAAASNITTSAGALTLDGAGGVDIDGSTISVDGTDNSNLTMTANDAGTKTLTIAASNSGAGTGAISVDADGTLTMDSDGALTMGGSSVDVDADNGTLSLDGSTGLNIGTAADVAIDMDASTLDIDASGAVTIDASGANAISIGAEANTGAINVGTGASARAIQVGNAASTSVGIDALAVTIESVNALSLTDGTADLAYDGSGNVALTSVAYAHTATGAISIDVVDNTASAYSIGSTGKADILKVVSTDTGEGVTMSGTLGVLGLSSLRGIDNANNGITNAGALSEVSSIASATASPTALDIDASGILQLDGAGGITIGVAADKAIDMDASTLDIDASGAVTIDGASTIQINAVTSTTFTGDVKGPKSTGDDEFVTYWQLDSLANTAAFNETYKATNTGVDQTLTNGTLTRVKITGAPGYGTENSDPAINFAPNPAPITLLTSGGPGSEGGFAHHFNLSDKGVYQVMLTMELDNTGNEDAFVKVELMNNNPSPAVGETNPRVLASDTEVVYEDWSGVGAGADLRSHVNMSMMFVTLEDDEDVYANIIAYNGGGGGTAAVVIRTLSFSVSRVGEK